MQVAKTVLPFPCERKLVPKAFEIEEIVPLSQENLGKMESLFLQYFFFNIPHTIKL